jgi:hypothetical protein
MAALDAPAVAALLVELGRRTALAGDNYFRAKAYQRAADRLSTLAEPLDRVIAENRLRKLPGIGETIADIVTKLHRTGTHPLLEKLRKDLPDGVLNMLSIPGLKPEKINILHKELGIRPRCARSRRPPRPADAEAGRFAATLARNQAALEAQQRQMAVLDTQESQLRAEIKAKQAVLDLAKINLGYTRIVAPVDGMVSERGVRDGQYAHAGTQVITVVPLDNVWVLANYKETQLTHVAIGQRAEIRVDTFPGVVVNAIVDSIAPASGAQFSLLPPDNATGNFTKVVQRIPVKLRISPDNPLAGKLRPGMSVVATILTDTTPRP